jgi:hypothetical protein
MRTIKEVGTYHPVKFTPLVSLRQTIRTFTLSRTELPEVLRCLWDGVGEEMEFDAAQRLTCRGQCYTWDLESPIWEGTWMTESGG